MFLKNFNLLFKIGSAFFLFGFVLWYENLIYNLLLIALIITVLVKDKITLFRFPRHGYFFAVLLCFLFLFRAVNGYGKVLIELPFGITLTDQGAENALNFITQVVLIFLLFGLAVYTTERGELLYYFERMNLSRSKSMLALQQWLRIVMYVLYLLPKSFDYRKEVTETLKIRVEENRFTPLTRAKNVLDSIYQFIFNILKRSESEYPVFLKKNQSELLPVPPSPVNRQHISLSILIVGLHLVLIWSNS